MGTKSRDDDRAASAVEARIVDKGNLRRGVEAAKYMSSVIRLAHCFAPVGQSAVTQHEADPSESEVLAMIAHETAVHEGTADAIVLSVPGIACKISASGHGVIHLAEGEGFVGAVVPAGAQIDAEVSRKILFEVDRDAGLDRAWMTVESDIGHGILPVKIGLVGFAIVAEGYVAEEWGRRWITCDT